MVSFSLIFGDTSLALSLPPSTFLIDISILISHIMQFYHENSINSAFQSLDLFLFLTFNFSSILGIMADIENIHAKTPDQIDKLAPLAVGGNFSSLLRWLRTFFNYKVVWLFLLDQKLNRHLGYFSGTMINSKCAWPLPNLTRSCFSQCSWSNYWHRYFLKPCPHSTKHRVRWHDADSLG